MSSAIDARQIRRWQEEVAEDSGSPAFLPLAEVYRREGRLEVARKLCLRGLARHPENVPAHVLLGRIYRETGELERAFDEMEIAVTLEPTHRAARRAIGYLCLERRDWTGAVRHLEAAYAQEPSDQRVASALALARRHADADRPGPAAEDVADALNPALDRFVRQSRVRLLLVIDGGGRILAQHGFSRDLDLAAFATLGAGIQSASRALAGLLGQPGFDQLYQGEGERQLFLGPIPTPAGELILLTVFGSETTIGMVRVHFDELATLVTSFDWRIDSTLVDAAGYEFSLRAGLDAARASGSTLFRA